MLIGDMGACIHNDHAHQSQVEGNNSQPLMHTAADSWQSACEWNKRTFLGVMRRWLFANWCWFEWAKSTWASLVLFWSLEHLCRRNIPTSLPRGRRRTATHKRDAALERVKRWAIHHLQQYRQWECLLVRPEGFKQKVITFMGVQLISNNDTFLIYIHAYLWHVIIFFYLLMNPVPSKWVPWFLMQCCHRCKDVP